MLYSLVSRLVETGIVEKLYEKSIARMFSELPKSEKVTLKFKNKLCRMQKNQYVYKMMRVMGSYY